jgi:GNAT superfamily N-acetyltransferase
MTDHALFDLDGTTDLPPGKIASVVTYLAMAAPPAARPPDPRLTLARLTGADAARYLRIYRTIAERWFWFSRLGMAPATLAALLDDPGVQAFAAIVDGVDAGVVEIDFRVPGEAELVYFGLTGDHVGKGLGRVLMDRAQAVAWSAPIARFWLHTCTLDHPGAVAFYRRCGFVPYKLAVEIADDPRLTGALPRNAFPDVPLQEP